MGQWEWQSTSLSIHLSVRYVKSALITGILTAKLAVLMDIDMPVLNGLS